MPSRVTLDGYPQSSGNKRESVFIHTGPAAYVVVVPGTPPTGGDPVSDVEAGLKYFDFISGAVSDDGTYRVEAMPATGNPQQAFPNPGTTGCPQRGWILRWVVVATGLEVGAGVALAARTVRLRAIGPK